jgi:hypothetical protein
MGLTAIAPAVAGIICAAVALASPATADPTPGHDTLVHTQTPPMLCQIGSDDSDPGVGPNVVCQGGFVRAPADDDQAVITASGTFSYRSANIGVGYPHAPFDTLVPGRTYHIQGWIVAAENDGIRFTNDGTGHGMFIAGNTTVKPF